MILEGRRVGLSILTRHLTHQPKLSNPTPTTFDGWSPLPRTKTDESVSGSSHEKPTPTNLPLPLSKLAIHHSRLLSHTQIWSDLDKIHLDPVTSWGDPANSWPDPTRSHSCYCSFDFNQNRLRRYELKLTQPVVSNGQWRGNFPITQSCRVSFWLGTNLTCGQP